jgi:hypothetical protein
MPARMVNDASGCLAAKKCKAYFSEGQDILLKDPNKGGKHHERQKCKFEH